jgi:hypothetical protein
VRDLSRRLLPLIEVAAGVLFLGLAVAFAWRDTGDAQRLPLDAAALQVGPASERWYGIYLQGQHVGYSVSRVTPVDGGGNLYEQRSSFRVATFGRLQEILTAGAALVSAEGTPSRFDFFMVADQVRLSVRGEVQADEIVMDVEQAGVVSQLRFPISSPPTFNVSVEDAIRRQELRVGHRFSVPYFDPVTLAEGQMEMEVVDVEVLPSGNEAWWLESNFLGVEARALVDANGEILRQQAGMGLESVRMTREAATTVPTTDEPVDLISTSAVTLQGEIPNPREVRQLRLRVRGVEPEKVPSEGPWQQRDGDILTLQQADVEALRADLPYEPQLDGPLEPWLTATATLPAAHPDMQNKAAEVLAGVTDRRSAARRLVEHVYDYVEKVPSIGVPNGLEVLRSARGDCNEHTAYYVSLARAALIPARIAAGVVYSDRVGDRGAFYYHAWPEVLLGDPADPGAWIPVDPTFGQFPADATHIKLVEGDLDQQVHIMAFMGRLGFELLPDAPPAPGAP